MLLIYTQKVTPRIVYIFKHMCTNLLGIPIKFTTKIEEFIAHGGMKLSYGKQSMGNELFVQKAELLMEQGFTEVDIKVQPWDDTLCFFSVPAETSALPFDIFAASFYLLSRYEEYLPHVKDESGRFPATESLAYQEDFLQLPVVEIWANKFKEVLQQRFSDIEFEEMQFKTKAIIAVEQVFSYQDKGFVRSLGGIFSDLVKLNFSKNLDRIKVLLQIKKDPLDVFENLIEFMKLHQLKMLFMFQVSDFSIYDRNINYNRLSYRTVIKYVGDYARVGVILGYYALQNARILRKEKLRMEEIIHSPLENVMNTRYNLTLPEHYTHLTELDIKNDYSMGYADTLGFRAGTSRPFLFYDINTEATTPLNVHPFVFHSEIVEKADVSQLRKDVAGVVREVKDVGGVFKAVFRNQDFSEYANQELYYSFLKQIYEIE